MRAALPRIQLPQFSGKCQEWPAFRDLFKSMVTADRGLTDVEKLHYLKVSVKGDAEQLIRNLPVTGENFDRAWSLLAGHYENKRVLVAAFFNAFTSIPKMKAESVGDLKRIFHGVLNTAGSLEGVGRPISKCGDLFVHLAVELLDSKSRRDWESAVGGSSDPPSYDELVQFLERKLRTLEALSTGKQESSSSKTESSGRARAHHAKSQDNNRGRCPLCSKQHYVLFCDKFQTRSAKERRDVVDRNNLCLNCLGKHSVNACNSAKTCKHCAEKHHSSLHDSFESAKSEPTETVSCATSQVSPGRTGDRGGRLLATARIKVVDREGEHHLARALVDPGSEISLISEALAQRLRLSRSATTLSIVGVGGVSSGATRGSVRVNVLTRFGVPVVDVRAFVLPRLTSYGQRFSISGESWSHLNDLELADPDFLTKGQIDLILGADAFALLVLEGVRKGAPGEPIALKTELGWVVSGETGGRTPSSSVSALQCSVDEELLASVRQFWEQEEAPTGPPPLTPDEIKCLEHFKATHTRQRDGRYIVRLPLAKALPNLTDTRHSAVRMLRAAERRFARDPAFCQQYESFMREYETLGHMTAVPPANLDAKARCCFLPHHGVLKEASTSTKLRVVFNGSQKTREGRSLNEALMIGPNLLPRLADVLLKWRRHRLVYATDIEKMYRQILVHPDDRDLQRILWPHHEELQEYQLNTVTYGLASAPFLAIQTLQQLAVDEGEGFPLGAAALIDDSYVDDVLTGASSPDQAVALRMQLEQLCSRGGFPLRKWASNDESLLEGIPSEHRAAKAALTWRSRDISHGTLGLEWRPHSDEFSFVIRSLGESASTRRGILSQAAQLFDPLGWLSPVIISAKCVIQTTWLRHIGWDSRLPEDDVTAWRAFCEELPRLREIRVPRWIGVDLSKTNTELHGFADASERAYAAVLYLRSTVNAKVTVALLFAKTKVAPLKRVSLPRLELCAANLLVTIAAHAQKILGLSSSVTHLWTDSMVALGWIRGHPCQWTTFVANRVAEIQRTLPDAEWHHVAGKQNPADCASRGITPSALLVHSLWWQGPEFLRSHQWRSVPDLDVQSDLPERNRTMHVALEKGDIKECEILTQHSLLGRLLRVTAWMRRWRSRRQDHELEPSLSPEELRQAELLWVRHVQSAAYSAELKAVRSGEALLGKSALFKLTPFEDEEGLLRVGGRLKHALLGHHQRHPIILPPRSHLTRLIIEAAHKRALHGGVQLTLSFVRQRFWVPRSRQLVKHAIYRCLPCVRWRAASPQPIMSNLPEARVAPCRPFLKTGVDYAGPILLRTARGRGHKAFKAFIAVFVCFSSRAVHLEVASDYSADAFLAAFRRFTSRRGACRDVYSDCGTNFVGADSQLRALFRAATPDSQRIVGSLANQGSRWHFNPPGAPHFGGLWEAAVKSVKHHLRRVLGTTTLTYEEMSTLLAQIEACLNSRPLQALSDDAEDLAALTPGHFLIGEPLSAIPEPSCEETPAGRLTRWQLLQQMRDHLWRRWSQEYLASLIPRSKWCSEAPELQVGQLCLVRSEATPPCKWPLARITQLHVGDGGQVRVVTVRTATTNLTRPIVKIVLLPSASSASERA